MKDRRAKLDPAALGFSLGRRRTPGLRREEVAQRASISPTWYTWLEQGRGGAPSADVLDRIASALMLTDVEREHLFLLGLGRPPEVRYQNNDGITPRLQRVLDALNPTPALIRNATWDVVAWNYAATTLLADYGSLPPEQRNILRLLFLNPRSRTLQYDWEDRRAVCGGRFPRGRGACRRDSQGRAVSGGAEPSQPGVRRILGAKNDVSIHGEAVKHIRHPVLGGVRFRVFVVCGGWAVGSQFGGL